ncbi:MAG: hypothetical protein HKM98_10245 [Gammaproteobacteria bacterium]|nr:hypothetical protein [Gammaproteobacteria bacterium]
MVRNPVIKNPSNNSLRLIFFGLISFSLSGCVTSRIEEARHTATGISDDEAIVILTQRQNVDSQTEDTFVNCLDKELGHGLNLHEEREFMDQLFPWFEPAHAPNHADALRELLNRPGVPERIAETGVRYLVWIDGNTQTIDGGGNLSCSVGAGGAGCFGFQWWEDDSSYEAAIWDLKTLEHVGTISADAVGTSYLPAVVIPIPLIARTKNAACDGMADQLREFLVADPSD